MADWYISGEGDLAVAPDGDIAVTVNDFRDDAQQVYIRLMTEPGDFLLYPTLGADLKQLFGMPQSEETGQYGVALINAALQREGRFQGKTVTITPIPIGPQTIRFDVYVASAGRSVLALSIEKNLGVQ